MTQPSLEPAKQPAVDTLFTPADAASRSVRALIIDLLWTLPFLFLFYCNLAHHEMWLDELNAWGISAASPTLSALFANVPYEGHPWLWYFLLWVPSRATHDPVAMKWVEALIGTAIYLVIGFAAPFTRWQKLLLFLNYFVVFEYTVISRPYGVMLLCALLYTWRRAAKPGSWIANLALLGALANTDMTGIVLSGALLLEYLVSQWPRRRELPTPTVIAALALYFLMLLFSVHSLLPAPDISWSTTGHMFAHAGSVKNLTHAVGDVVVAPWWPLASGYPHQYWNTDVDFNRIALVFIPFVVAGYWWIFRRQPHLLVLLGAAIAFAVAFAHLIYLGYVRHWGVGVLAFLLALWIQRQEDGKLQRMSRIATLLLVIGAVKGVAAVAASWTHPFSQTAIAAQWLRDHQLDREPIAGSLDYDLAGVAEQLQRPVYFLECNCVDTYMKFSHRRDGLTPDQLVPRIVRAYDSLHADKLVLLMGAALASADVDQLVYDGMRVQPLASFTGSEDHLDFYLYEVKRDKVQR